MLGSRLRRAAVALSLVAAPLAVVTATAQPAAAHTCVQVRVYLDGSMIPIGACHSDNGDPFDVCGSVDFPLEWEPLLSDTGVGITICVEVPVAYP